MASLTTPLPPGLLPEPGSVPPVAAPEFSLGAPAGEQQPGFIVGQVRAAYEDLDAIAAGFQSSLVGTAIRSTIPAIVDRVSNWQLDPSFSARHPKYFNDQWLGEHPWMIEAYANGSADTIPNETAFAHFMSRAEEDWNIRSRLGQAGFGRQIVGGIIGGIPDFILGGMVARGVGVAGYLERAREWATTGGYLERAIKASTIGAAGNLSYDAAIRAASPSSREPWTADEAANTAMVGAGFGLGLASLSMLAGTARGRNLAGRIGDAVANPELTTLAEAAKKEAAAAKARLDAIIANQPGGEALGGVPIGPNATPVLDPGILHRFAPFEHSGLKQTPESFVLTPDTIPVKDAIEAAGGTFVEHPAQAWHDLQATQNELARASTGSKFSDALRAAFGIATPATKRIGEARPKLTREAGRLFFDFTDPTTEHVKNPVTAETGIPAESLKWNIDNEHDALVKTTGAAYQLWRDEQGKKITQGGRAEFDTAITDYMRAQDEFRRGARTTLPEVSPNVATAAKAMSEYAKAQAERMRDVGLLAEDASHNPWYITRRWNVPEIIRRRTEVESLLADQLKLNRERDFNTGAKIDPDTRPLEMEAIEHGRKDRAPGDLGLDAEERAAIKRTIAEFQKNEAELTPGGGVGKPPKEMTEGDLKSLTKGLFGQDLYQRYLQEVDLWHRGKIRSWIDDMSKPSEGHGVESALSNPSPIKGRVLKVNESNFADFLDRDAQGLVNAYHAKMAGEIAARQAIKASAERWSPLVLKSTGKVLSEEAYNPDLILQTVADDSATWLKAAEQTGDQKRVDQVRAENKKSYAALSGKLDQLRRKGPAGPESPLWKFTSMQVAKMTQIGLMGKTGIAALAETASVMPALHPDRRSMELFLQALNVTKELSVPEMQAFEVATRDIALLNRDVEITGLTDAFDRERFGPGLAGRAMTAIDRTTSRASDTFMRITGLPRITSNARNAMSVVVMNKVIVGARKMAVAQGLIEKGMSEAEAVVKAGLSAEEATNLSRLGFDGKRAAKLTSLIEQHGQDYHGNAVTPDTTDWVHPNAHAWADANPDIWNRLRHAVNSEVMDQIVEPKVLSRARTAGTPLGRVFHQFMSFAYAWGNQFYPMLARQPAGAQARFLMFSLASAAMADALYNALSGRRSLDQTAEQWGSNPAGMVYAAIMRSAWPGWFQRPLGLLEFTPIGPAKLLGNQNLSTVYGRKDMNLGTLLGPGGSWINNVITAGQKALNEGSFTPSSNRALWNAMPFHNLWQLEAANRISEWMGGPTLMGPEPRRAP